MIQLIYSSCAAPDLPSGEIFRIVQKSASNNAFNQLSGFLIYFDQRFFQVIEGPETAVDALIKVIKADPRHHSINILSRGAISGTHFPKWMMKRLVAMPTTRSLDDIDPVLNKAPANIRIALEKFLAIQASSKAA